MMKRRRRRSNIICDCALIGRADAHLSILYHGPSAHLLGSAAPSITITGDAQNASHPYARGTPCIPRKPCGT